MKTLRARVAGLTVGVVALATALPVAADGPPGRADFARPYQPSIWQGAYAGLHLGWGEADPADGFVGGFQAGYNWQSGQIVYGLEADVSFADIDARFMGGNVSVDWLGTVRGRVGYLLSPRILAYGTAGFGIAKASASFGPFSDSDTESDFVYGLGIEGKINPSMSLRLEYLAFGDLDVDVVRAGINFKLGY